MGWLSLYIPIPFVGDRLVWTYDKEFDINNHVEVVDLANWHDSERDGDETEEVVDSVNVGEDSRRHVHDDSKAKESCREEGGNGNIRRRVVSGATTGGDGETDATTEEETDDHGNGDDGGTCSHCKGGPAVAKLRRYLSKIVSTPLDKDKPLWMCQLLHLSPRCKVLVLRVHHGVADGYALVRFVMSITDQHFGKETSFDYHSAKSAAISTLKDSAALSDSETVATTTSDLSINTPATTPASASTTPTASSPLPVPSHSGTATKYTWLKRRTLADRIVFAGRMLTMVPRWLIRMTFMRTDPPTSCLRRRKRERGNSTVAWLTPTLPLQVVKEIAKASGINGTVNDVLLAAVSGALRNYQIEENQRLKVRQQGERSKQRELGEGDVDKVDDIQCFIPIGSAFSSGRKLELVNRFGMLILPLPLHLENKRPSEQHLQQHRRQQKSMNASSSDFSSPLAHLLAVKHEMDALKETPDFFLSYYLAWFVSMLFPPYWFQLLTKYATGKASLVLTNVRGPDGKLTVMGRTVSSVVFFVPASGFLSTSIGAFWCRTREFGFDALDRDVYVQRASVDRTEQRRHLHRGSTPTCRFGSEGN